MLRFKVLTQEKVRELFYYNPDTGNLIWLENRGRNKTKGVIAGDLGPTDTNMFG